MGKLCGKVKCQEDRRLKGIAFDQTNANNIGIIYMKPNHKIVE